LALRYRPHQSHKTAGLLRVAGELFEKYVDKLIAAMIPAAAASGISVPAIPQELVDQIAERASRHARGVYLKRARQAKRAASRRHRLSRRINFGLVAGNRSRRSCSGR